MNINHIPPAVSKKPHVKYGTVIATDRGWEVEFKEERRNELLVCCPGLKKMLAPTQIEPPVEIVPEPNEDQTPEPTSDPPFPEPEPQTIEPTNISEIDPEPTPEPVSTRYTAEEMSEMKMAQIREIGDKYGVADTKKSDLIEKILNAQN